LNRVKIHGGEIPHIYWSFVNMTDSENRPDGVNNRRTQAHSDTNVTHVRSGFDLEDTRRVRIAKRVKAGANSPKGYSCSMLSEQLPILESYVPQRWATYPCQTLGWAVDWQMSRLAGAA
jgi:hypothetical protein